MMNTFKSILAVIFLLVPLAVSSKVLTADITKYGAVADGKTLNTLAIQKAINAASNHKGGGRVVIGSGRWLTGMLVFDDAQNKKLEDVNFPDNQIFEVK